MSESPCQKLLKMVEEYPNAAKDGADSYTKGYMSLQPGTSVTFKDGPGTSRGTVVSRDKDMFFIKRTDGSTVKVGYGNIQK